MSTFLQQCWKQGKEKTSDDDDDDYNDNVDDKYIFHTLIHKREIKRGREM